MERAPHSNCPPPLPQEEQGTSCTAPIFLPTGPKAQGPVGGGSLQLLEPFHPRTTTDPANIRRCEQGCRFPRTLCAKKPAYTLTHGQNHGLIRLQCPRCLEYVFLTDLCICAIRRAAVTELISDCSALTSGCSSPAVRRSALRCRLLPVHV